MDEWGPGPVQHAVHSVPNRQPAAPVPMEEVQFHPGPSTQVAIAQPRPIAPQDSFSNPQDDQQMFPFAGDNVVSISTCLIVRV